MKAEPLRSFRVIAEAMPQLVWATDAAGTIDYFNRRWVEYTGIGLDQLESQQGRTAGVVHPDELAEMWERWRAALKSGEPYEMEYRLRNAADGSYRWFLTRAIPMRDERRAIAGWVGTATDIDDQRRANDSLRFVVDTGNAFAASLEVETICNALARVAIDRFADWCIVTLCQEERLNSVAIAHKNAELLEYVEQFRARYPTRPQDRLARVIADNEPQLIERVSREQLRLAARDAEHLELLERLRMHSVMIVPLSTAEGTVYGALSMISAESGRIFTAGDLDVAATVAKRAAVAIANATIYQEERARAERLRFSARVNQLLLESSDAWEALERVAEVVASELADACLVGRLQDDTVRTEIVVHRDPAVHAVIQSLRGQRVLQAEAEHAMAAQLRKHQSVVRTEEAEQIQHVSWPYLVQTIQEMQTVASVVVPLYSAQTTYGALAAYYTREPERAERDRPLLEEIAARASVAVERMETFERERRIATTLQQASLPSLIPQPAGVRFDAVYLPAGDEADVGGDWYDAIELDDGSVVLSVGDVTGRGIQAAAIMSKVRHAMGMAPLHEPDPARVLDAAEWFLRKRYPHAIVTAFAAILDKDRRCLRFAGAGHPWPILRRGSETIELRSNGLPLGLRDLDQPAQSRSIELQDGDMLVLYTDGLTEWRRDVLGETQRLLDVLRSDAIAVTQHPAHLIERACLEGRPHDDVAILAVAIGRQPYWSFLVEDARAAAGARAQFVEAVAGIDDDDDFVARAELIFGELLGNVVRHAPGPVEVVLFSDGKETTLHVIDSGKPYDHAGGLPDDVLSELGRGLYIIGQLAKEVRVEHVGNYGNHTSVKL